MVTTYEFAAAGSDSTTVKVSVHASGEIEDGLQAVIEGVWHHFLVERFKPFIESEGH
jgi:hypothetical protein